MSLSLDKPKLRRGAGIVARRKPARTAAVVASAQKPVALLSDLRELILQTREVVARAVDSGLTTLYWHVGRRIRQDILKERRADYGAQIVSALGAQLEAEFGRGFGEKNLRRIDSARRSFSRLADCRIADATIDVDPLHRADAAGQAARARVLRGDVPSGVLERAPENQRHALRAHGPFAKAGKAGGDGTQTIAR